MNIIEQRNYFLGFSSIIVLISIVLVSVFGLRAGIDLKGGTQWQIGFSSSFLGENNINEDTIRTAIFAVSQEQDIIIMKQSDGNFLVRLPSISEEIHQRYINAIQPLNLEEKSFSNIGPTIGEELRTKSLWAIIIVLCAISLYIAFAFRKVSEPVKSWKYGVVTLITLLHDVIVPTGLLALLGAWKGIEIDTNFIVALLVVMGFSVHDTIVVFDRIRETLLHVKGKNIDLGQIINTSVHETFVRSVNTSLTLVLVLVALLFIGPSSLYYFILTILVGTIFGTYSSIFVASPLLYLWGRNIK